MVNFEKVLDNLSSLLLIFVGISSLVIGVADFAGWERILQSTTKDPLSLILVAVGMLSLSLGLERVQRLKKLDRQLDRFSSLLSGLKGCQQLIGQAEVYGTASRLCDTAQNQIRAMVVGKSTKAPREFAEAVAKKLRASKDIGSPIKYEAVIVIDSENLPQDFDEGINRRLSTYERFRISQLASIYLFDLKPPLGFDILIVDRIHVIIAMTTHAGVGTLQRGLLFENQPSIATELADWYDQNIIRLAVPYEIWTQERQQNDGYEI